MNARRVALALFVVLVSAGIAWLRANPPDALSDPEPIPDQHGVAVEFGLPADLEPATFRSDGEDLHLTVSSAWWRHSVAWRTHVLTEIGAQWALDKHNLRGSVFVVTGENEFPSRLRVVTAFYQVYPAGVSGF